MMILKLRLSKTPGEVRETDEINYFQIQKTYNQLGGSATQLLLTLSYLKLPLVRILKFSSSKNINTREDFSSLFMKEHSKPLTSY